MPTNLKQLEQTALGEISQVKDLKTLEQLRIKYLGRKGELTKILRGLVSLPKNKRVLIGQQANQLKARIENKLGAKRNEMAKAGLRDLTKKEQIDLTLPGIKFPQGHLHPITQVRREVEEIFKSMGFLVVEGPEVETDYYNFDALNIPPEHPARDLWDTFWIKGIKGKLLRTHTSPMQARFMEKHQPPLRIIVPGRCFRHEATDASHETTFYQIEGLMVDKEVSLANLKNILDQLVQKLFGKKTKTRLRPGYFPFVEPGFELDINCIVCGGKGCSVCRKTGWVEIIPCGMVHPNVFKAAGYNPRQWQGFAFGMGLDRVTMMKYGIDDIRLFHSGDLRFLKQF
ncbi:MAG TPA: phenylalanine--tRNA ligase subunit alpha [Candidatus Portnoybacteria bacterium]|nr:phenylalanine--tRNA ligase subunit alpha [Candidatus Portnoybacteria bacterium]